MAEWSPSEKTKDYQQVESIRQAIKNADVIMALIEWSQITQFEFKAKDKTNDLYFIDARNQFKPDKIKQAGYEYIGVGQNN
jgi:UDP-glucose 6-dehydrogenase